MTNKNINFEKVQVTYNEETEELLLSWDENDPEVAALNDWTDQDWIDAIKREAFRDDESKCYDL